MPQEAESMGWILTAELDEFVSRVRGSGIPDLESLHLFGSASYGDFVYGYSDVDIFASFSGTDMYAYVKGVSLLKLCAEKSFTVRTVDINAALSTELELTCGPFNPFLLKEISISPVLWGEPVRFTFAESLLREDSLKVASWGLRMLRSAITRIDRMSPVVAIRFIDEMIFKSTKATLLAVSGELHSSRTQILAALESGYPGQDGSIYHDLLQIREDIGSGQDVNYRPDEILIRALLAFNEVWQRGLEQCKR